MNQDEYRDAFVFQDGIMKEATALPALIEAKEILDKFNVPFLLLWGVLLGAYRDNDFIESDFDIDLGFMHEDIVGKAELVGAEFERRGYQVKTTSRPFAYPRAVKAIKKGITPIIDLVDFALMGEHRVHIGTYAMECTFYRKEVFHGIETIKFKGIEFRCPNPEKFLNATYKNWRTPDDKDKFQAAMGEDAKRWQAIARTWTVMPKSPVGEKDAEKKEK